MTGEVSDEDLAVWSAMSDAELDAELRAEGVDDATSRGGRCEQICEIAAAICALEGQICGLVARHADDERYRAACERAAGDCRFATEACHACP